MQLWKLMALVVPAGLVLGMVGGKLAHPVVQEHAVEPGQSIFGKRAAQDGSADYPVQTDGPIAYVGGYSYPPDTTTWGPAGDSSGWQGADVPLPSVAELDARQAALLADPDEEFAVSPPSRETEEPPQPAAQVALAPPDTGAEPRTADGGLPAIW